MLLCLEHKKIKHSVESLTTFSLGLSRLLSVTKYMKGFNDSLDCIKHSVESLTTFSLKDSAVSFPSPNVAVTEDRPPLARTACASGA